MTAEEVTNGGQQAMEGEDITQKRDGGVLKLVKKEGTGSELPMTGDKVFVHYVGTLLDGTKFDSSRDRGEKFSFELGKVIKAWDLGVATMKVGEVSQLVCKPEYAYGTAGSPPKIPPNSTLVFEVELFEFHGEDVTEEEDGGIVRRIIAKGQGYSKPNEGATVEVTLEGKFEDRVFDEREMKFEVGDGENLGLPVGVEKAIMAMEQGEESLFTLTPKYGYGSAGNAKFNIPPGATLQYKLKLATFEKAKESWEMNTTEKLQQSAIVKKKEHSISNDRARVALSQDGKFKQASVQYKRIVAWLEHESGLQGEDEQKARALRLAAHLNLAMCYLKMQEQNLALESCNKALDLDDSSEKALFRRGEALFSMKEFERARADFQKVVQLYPANKAAKAQALLCQRHIKEQREKDKRLYANMFQKFAERDAKASPHDQKEAGKPSSGGTRKALHFAGESAVELAVTVFRLAVLRSPAGSLHARHSATPLSSQYRANAAPATTRARIVLNRWCPPEACSISICSIGFQPAPGGHFEERAVRSFRPGGGFWTCPEREVSVTYALTEDRSATSSTKWWRSALGVSVGAGSPGVTKEELVEGFHSHLPSCLRGL
ncbi:hypothetical protein COCON_G00230490 [Conger conger]|uniref:peptidylprolyl isomerase n=1 Tax=Conger conger TaxID=82655 RepID=A0A9Q1CVH5_CONCO|nr:hypothetical protein COCON_G00230490 [Conger conger]